MNHAFFDLFGAFIWLLSGIWLLNMAARSAIANRNADHSWKPGHVMNVIGALVYFCGAFIAFAVSWVQFGWTLETCR